MKKHLTKILGVTTAIGLFFSLPSSISAVCPVCTVAVIGGLGISKALGIDDTVTSVWIGGLMLSVSFWSIDWINKKGYLKKLNKKVLNWSVIIFWYALTFIPLYLEHYIGLPYNKILGIDKIIFGTIVGTAAFLIGMFLDRKQREKYGKQFFNYQKVVCPVGMLIAASLIMFLVTKYRLVW